MSLFNEEVLEKILLSLRGNNTEEDFNLGLYSRVQGLYLDRGYIYSRIDPQNNL